jgi:hypothetical protein
MNKCKKHNNKPKHAELLELVCYLPLSTALRQRLDKLLDKIDKWRADSVKKANPYLMMPIERVKVDAEYGVSLARSALRQREPELASKLRIGVEPPAGRR